MTLIDLVLIAVALSLDAFSVAISCGMKLSKESSSKFIKIALFFGVFQAVMPLLGFYLSHTFLKGFVSEYSRWLSFAVFLILSLKTFHDYFKESQCEEGSFCHCQSYRCLVTLSIATSIDAFIVGAVVGIQESMLFTAVALIGVITFLNSLIGCFLGNRSQTLLQEKSRLLAAILLMVLAIKSLF